MISRSTTQTHESRLAEMDSRVSDKYTYTRDTHTDYRIANTVLLSAFERLQLLGGSRRGVCEIAVSQVVPNGQFFC